MKALRVLHIVTMESKSFYLLFHAITKSIMRYGNQGMSALLAVDGDGGTWKSLSDIVGAPARFVLSAPTSLLTLLPSDHIATVHT
jgi:hypothetical protein